MGRGWKRFEVHARNMDIKGDSGKVLDGNEDSVIGDSKKGDPCY